MTLPDSATVIKLSSEGDDDDDDEDDDYGEEESNALEVAARKRADSRRLWGLVMQHRYWMAAAMAGAAVFSAVFPGTVHCTLNTVH
jgi:hypothetical protein